jgi:hypothetical protein
MSSAAPWLASLDRLIVCPAFVLGQTGMSELRIRAVFKQQIRSLSVVEDAAEPVALSRCREPRCDACPAYRVHIHTEID